jgi:hypothetical protein
VIGQGLVEGVTEIPAVGQVEVRCLDELSFRADALEEHDELQLEEDYGVDRGPATFGVPLPRPVAHEAQVQLRLQVPVEVGLRDHAFERDGNGFIEAAGFGRAEHRALLAVTQPQHAWRLSGSVRSGSFAQCVARVETVRSGPEWKRERGTPGGAMVYCVYCRVHLTPSPPWIHPSRSSDSYDPV